MSTSTNKTRRIVAAAALALALTGTVAQAAVQTEPQWLQALDARSEAMNELYAIGESGAVEPGYLAALNARSEAMNKLYGLGEDTPAAVSGSELEWLRALETRSDALNQKYGLGTYAQTTRAGDPGFDWVDAGVGVGVAFGAILFAAAAAAAARRRGRPAHLPS